MAKDWNMEIERKKAETEKDPDDANAWYNLGWAIIQSIGAKLQGGNIDAECKEKIPTAEAALKKAVELAPEHGRAHILLGQMLRYIKRYDEAIKYAKVGLGLPTDTQDWFAAAETVASCYMLKNDMPHSIEYLELIKEHYPDDAMTIFKRACCYWQAGNLDGAEEEFSHLIEVDPSHPNAASCLAQVRQKKASMGGGSKATPKDDKKALAASKKAEEEAKAKAAKKAEEEAKAREAEKAEEEAKVKAAKKADEEAKAKEAKKIEEAQAKAAKKASDNSKKVEDAQAKAQELGKKLTADIQKVMASDLPPDKKGAEVTKLQSEFNEKLSKLMKN